MRITNFTRKAARLSHLHLKKVIADSLLPFVFEPNDRLTRAHVTTHLEQLFDALKIEDYCIVCDETNNTPEVIDSCALIVDVATRQGTSPAWKHSHIKVECMAADWSEV